MKKIKIIDLIKNIYSNIDIPQKIKRNGYMYVYNSKTEDYYEASSDNSEGLFTSMFNTLRTNEILNEEVEIIKNTPKEEIDHLKKTVFSFNYKDKDSIEEAFIKLSQLVFETREKTDEIVDKVNNLQDQINFIK